VQTIRGEKIIVRGDVQGVGLRPFLCREANSLGLAGEVRNTGDGLEIRLVGNEHVVDRLLAKLSTAAPAAAHVAQVSREPLKHWSCAAGVRIVDSSGGNISTTIPTDLATCEQCLRELFDRDNRRFQHPFISCTDCGPRHSILLDLPWDRCRNSQGAFSQCPLCTAEVADASGRRFHSQTNSCHHCGPQLELLYDSGASSLHRAQALGSAVCLLRDGALLAVKGPGGYQLVTRADRAEGLARLRQLKQRQRKPLAVMFADLEQVEQYCLPSEQERELLRSGAAPIVLVQRRSGGAALQPAVAPGLHRLGAMLPATPLQHLLLRAVAAPLVTTSANLRGETLCYRDAEALEIFAPIVDGILRHDREIRHPLDDSIVQSVAGRPMLLRRARGYSAHIASLAQPYPTAVAAGADLNNCPALNAGSSLLCAPHVGDLDAVSAQQRHRARVKDLCQLYGLAAETALCDLHPDYHSRHLALASGLPVHALQHHRAHLYATLAENPEAARPLLAVIWDGAGYGGNNELWGGEFIVLDEQGERRLGSLRPFPLPGGEQAIREPRRTALGLLQALNDTAEMPAALQAQFNEREQVLLLAMLEKSLNSPQCSSVGRLFDGVAALLAGHSVNDYQGEAAVQLEQLAASYTGIDALSPWPMPLERSGQHWQLDWRPLLRELLDSTATTPAGEQAARFHVSLAHAILELAKAAGCQHILLGGGCFQNRLLTELTLQLADKRHCTVHWPRRLPPGDGGIAIGQLYALLTGVR